MRIPSLIASSSSARPSARRPRSAGHSPGLLRWVAAGLVAGGTAESQALIVYPNGVLQYPLGEAQAAEAVVSNHQSGPAAFQHGEAERLLPIALALSDVSTSMA